MDHIKPRAKYPHLAERFVTGDLFDPPEEMRGAYDVVLEHTCMSALPPTMRLNYRRGIDLTLRRGGLLIGVWFINPALDLIFSTAIGNFDLTAYEAAAARDDRPSRPSLM